MLKQRLKLLGLALLIFVIGFSAGKFSGPASVEERIVEVEKEQTDRQTNTTIIETPDGTKKTIIEMVETVKRERAKETEKITENKPNVSLFGGTGYSFEAGRQTYIGGATFRVISNISISIYGTTQKEVGVFLTIPIR